MLAPWKKALTNLYYILKAETSLCVSRNELGLNKTLGCKLALSFSLSFISGRDILSYCLALSGWVSCRYEPPFYAATVGKRVAESESKPVVRQRKGKFIERKREVTGPYRMSVLLLKGLSYTLPMKNSLWWVISHSWVSLLVVRGLESSGFSWEGRRSGKTECCLVIRVSPKGHCDFIFCLAYQDHELASMKLQIDLRFSLFDLG